MKASLVNPPTPTMSWWSNLHLFDFAEESRRQHFPTAPNCEIRGPQYFGDAITADRKFLNGETESRLQHRHADVVQDLDSYWIQCCHAKGKTAQETMNILQKFLPPDLKPRISHTTHSQSLLAIVKTCVGITTSQPHADAKTKQSVGSKKAPLHFWFSMVLQKKWWGEAMECFCYFRNIQE